MGGVGGSASTPLCACSLYDISFSILYSSKVAFEFFKERGAIELQQKPRIADYWALMRSTPSLPSSRKHLMLFCLAWRIDQASKKCRVGRLKKRQGVERKREREKEGESGCRSFNHGCLTALCGGTKEMREGGREGSRERERGRNGGERRDSLKHTAFMLGKFWTTLVTSKCFH